MQWLGIDDFKRQPAEDAGLRKGFAAEVKADDSKRELTFKISTAAVDRVGDTINVDGWDVAQYVKNPVVMLLPVAKATKVWADSAALHATAEFTPAGMVRFNDIVFDLYKGGFLNAVSVGFRPTKWAFVEDKDRPCGVDFEKQELLEFSAVPVPANPEALIEARAAGADMEEVKGWAFSVIRAVAKPQTIREVEGILREVGFSQKEAKEIASHGFKSLHRESEAESATKQRDDDAEIVLAELRKAAIDAVLKFR